MKIVTNFILIIITKNKWYCMYVIRISKFGKPYWKREHIKNKTKKKKSMIGY